MRSLTICSLLLLASCTAPEGRRLLRGTHITASHYDGSLDYPVANKRDFNESGYSVGIIFDLGALIPPEPQPVYTVPPPPPPPECPKPEKPK